MTAKVVAEVGLDPTEAALAELYAYVQSQPESEIKKKWVHKFNKENGCGTPKVILNSSLSDACAKNCKNLSQSIRVSLFVISFLVNNINGPFLLCFFFRNIYSMEPVLLRREDALNLPVVLMLSATLEKLRPLF